MVYEIRKQVREKKYILPWNFQSAALSYHTGNASRITAVKRCLGARPPIVFIFFSFCFLPLWTLLKSVNRLPEILFRSSEMPELDFGDELIISKWLNIFWILFSLQCCDVTRVLVMCKISINTYFLQQLDIIDSVLFSSLLSTKFPNVHFPADMRQFVYITRFALNCVC